MDAILWLFAGIGHLALWSWLFNRTHATAWPRSWRKVIEWGVIGVVLAPAGLVAWKLARGESLAWTPQWGIAPGWIIYSAGCSLLSVYFIGSWVYRRLSYQVPPTVRRREREVIRVADHVHQTLEQDWLARGLSWVPGNQATCVALEESELALAPPDSALCGFKICHLSDFHLTGSIAAAYYEYIMQRVNEWRPDLVAITGDLVDEPRCLDWIQPIFAALRARHGVFYVLGNHDRRIRDESELRSRLERAGLIAAAGTWHDIAIGDSTICLAGNELPWYAQASAPRAEKSGASTGFTIALMHSPDQFPWARAVGADVALAGHLHGGQICFPIVGPIIAPSRYGVKFVPEFHPLGDGLMIVSRGLSGDEPIRWRCLPQVGFYRLAPRPIDPPVGKNYTGRASRAVN